LLLALENEEKLNALQAEENKISSLEKALKNAQLKIQALTLE